MKAMILAAGKGTRLEPLTHTMPKPMIPVLGKPVMQYLLEHLKTYGTRQIMVNTSHLADKIKNYFGSGHQWGVEIGYSFEGTLQDGQIIAQPLGSAGGIKRIQEFGATEFFDDTFWVVCGDAIIDFDLHRVRWEHDRSNSKASIVVAKVPREKVERYGVVVCDENDRIIEFQEKPSREEAKSTLVNTGVYVFEPEILDLIPQAEEYDIGSQLIPAMLEEDLPLHAIEVPYSEWIDIGQMSDYWEANQALMQGRLESVSMPGTEIKPGIYTGLNVNVQSDQIEGPVYIGSGSHIEPGCEIYGPTWIGDGCHLKSGAYIRRSILFDYNRLGSRSRIEDSLVFGRYCVDRNGKEVPDPEGNRN
jgi:mannose-1-phosphate guanylyltransferase